MLSGLPNLLHFYMLHLASNSHMHAEPRSVTEHFDAQKWSAAQKELAVFASSIPQLPNLPMGTIAAGATACFEVFGMFCVGEIIGRRQLVGT